MKFMEELNNETEKDKKKEIFYNIIIYVSSMKYYVNMKENYNILKQQLETKINSFYEDNSINENDKLFLTKFLNV